MLRLLPGSILNRLREMRCFGFVAVQVHNRPREFQDAMVSARAHLHLLHRRAQQIPAGIINRAILPHLGGTHVGVYLQIRSGKALALALA